MYQHIPGGSSMKIGFDDEFVEVHLPPVGYVIDKIPDPETGRPSEKLIKSEILFQDIPIEERKWKRTELPKDWKKWMEDERLNKQIKPDYTNSDADQFRAQEWRRRINGVWISLGNKDGQPAEYYYLTGTAYLYFNWWEVDFGLLFRVVLLKIFYLLEYVEENPLLYGLVLSTARRVGKTAIAFCWYYDYPSRFKNSYAGMQAKKQKDAAKKFKINVVGPWRRLPEFFRPIYNTTDTQVSSIEFIKTAGKGNKSLDNFDEDNSLHSILDYKDSSPTAYDQAKLHRYVTEEPGKWEESDIYTTIHKVIPALKEQSKIIGKAFCPSTVEELEKGGDSFIELFEDSLPSLMKKYDGRTKSGLLSMFIPATECYVFDEFGRSIVEDPSPKKQVIGEDGKQIFKGAKTQLLEERKVVESDLPKLTEVMRKYPWSWAEAKSMSNEFCHFNHQLLQKQLQNLRSKPPMWVKGNLDWVSEKDGDVNFIRDDHKGRFKFAWLPDEDGSGGDVEKKNKILNNVIIDWDSENQRRIYKPKNDHLFACGGDPIRNVKTDDPTASKAAFYVFRKFDASVDHGKPKEEWQSYKFIVQYLTRPEDPEIFHEDMIKLVRFFSCSILPEDNVETLRQHFDSRGYGAFILYRGNFDEQSLPGVKTDDDYKEKPLRSDTEVINNYVSKLNMYYNRHIERVPFEELIEQSLKFRIAKHYMQDAVVGAGYTLIAAEAKVETHEDTTNEIPIEVSINPFYDVSGDNSREIDIDELLFFE